MCCVASGLWMNRRHGREIRRQIGWSPGWTGRPGCPCLWEIGGGGPMVVEVLDTERTKQQTVSMCNIEI